MFGLETRQVLLLVTIWTGVFCNYVCYSVIAPFFPQVARKKGLTAEAYSIVFAFYSIAQIIFSFIAGKYLNKLGGRRFTVTSLAVTGLSTIALGCVDQITDKTTFLVVCLLVRFMEGAGFAAFFTSALSMIVRDFPSDPGYFVGLTESVVTLGMIMGPPLGSLLYETGGFAAPFVVFGCVLVLTSGLGILVIEGERGILVIEGERGERKESGVRVKDYIHLLEIPPAVLAMGCTLVNVASDIFILITLNSHLVQFKMTQLQSGFIYLCLFLSYGFSSPIAGKIADKTDLEFLLQSIGSASITVAFTLIGPAILPIKASIPLIVTGLLLKGLGAGPLISCSYTSCLKSVREAYPDEDPSKTYSLVSSLVSFSIPLGNLVGGFSAGILYEHLGMPHSCAIFAAIFILLAVICAIQQAKKQRNETRRSYYKLLDRSEQEEDESDQTLIST